MLSPPCAPLYPQTPWIRRFAPQPRNLSRKLRILRGRRQLKNCPSFGAASPRPARLSRFLLFTTYRLLFTSYMRFKLQSNYQPKGDQPQAIATLVRGLNDGLKDQVLLGITGSGKTFTIASVIQETQRPTLVLAHNKTLAAQLYQEFRSLFPENAVEYFVSYYDYYQPEAYVPAADVYIEKEAIINEEIDRLRMSATRALFERRDVIVVASVSCIYGLGDPDAYYGMLLFLEPGARIPRQTLLQKLVELQYERSDVNFQRGTFRVRGDVVEIFPSYQDQAFRIELWGDEVDSISTIDPLLGEVVQKHTSRVPIYPKTHYVMSRPTIKRAIKTIKEELEWWEPKLIQEGKLRSEEHTSELQSRLHLVCRLLLEKKKKKKQ